MKRHLMWMTIDNNLKKTQNMKIQQGYLVILPKCQKLKTW